MKLACIQQQNDNSVVGYYEWEGFFRSRASNTSSLTCFSPHKHVRCYGKLHAYIPAHVNTETANNGTSVRGKIFKVSFACCERCSGCDHMMMGGELRGVGGWGGGEEQFSPIKLHHCLLSHPCQHAACHVSLLLCLPVPVTRRGLRRG